MKTNKKFLSVILSVFIISSVILPHLSVIKAKAVNIFLSGDVNGNNIVSTDDALLALRFAAGIESPTQDEQEIADADFNGKVDTEDARKILKIAASIEPTIKYKFSDWYITRPATCQQEGIETSYCEEYGITRQRTIPSLQHSYKKGKCAYCNAQWYTLAKITVLNNELHLGNDYNTVINKLGNPTKTYYDIDVNGEALTYLIYHRNYINYTLITIHKTNGITSVYTYDKNASIEFYNGDKLSVNEITDGKTVDDVYLKLYTDNHANFLTPYACQFTLNYHTTAVHGKSNINSLNAIIFDLVNATRVANGASVLTYSPEVEKVALGHTMDMYKNNYFAHENAKGENVLNRLKNAGIYPNGCGENILRSSYITPYHIHDAWYNSLGHRKVMLNPIYTHIGIGTYVAPKNIGYSVYSTQNYIKTAT